MKKSELRQIISEEVRNIIQDNFLNPNIDKAIEKATAFAKKLESKYGFPVITIEVMGSDDNRYIAVKNETTNEHQLIDSSKDESYIISRLHIWDSNWKKFISDNIKSGLLEKPYTYDSMIKADIGGNSYEIINGRVSDVKPISTKNSRIYRQVDIHVK